MLQADAPPARRVHHRAAQSRGDPPQVPRHALKQLDYALFEYLDWCTNPALLPQQRPSRSFAPRPAERRDDADAKRRQQSYCAERQASGARSMSGQWSPEEIKSHFRVPRMHPECYLLVCDGSPVTVRSQQIRALNLLYALHLREQIEGRDIAVIG